MPVRGYELRPLFRYVAGVDNAFTLFQLKASMTLDAVAAPAAKSHNPIMAFCPFWPVFVHGFLPPFCPFWSVGPVDAHRGFASFIAG
jgi:hypothetical protein